MAIPQQIYPRLPKRLPLSENKYRYALDFNGVGPYISLNNPFAAAPFQQQGSFECFFTVSSTPPVHEVGPTMFGILRGGVSATSFCYRTRLIPAQDRLHVFWWELGWSNTRGFGLPMNLRGTGWHHVAFTWNATFVNSLSIYLDGVYINDPVFGQTPAGVSGDSGATAIIGASPNLLLDWFGNLAYMRMYNRPLTVVEVRHNMLNYHNPVGPGLILWFPFVEGVGTTTEDQSPIGNNGTLQPGGGEPDWIELMQWELLVEAGL